MPIYAYRCDSCGVRKDVLQKISDAPLAHCPDCGAESFHKELTAPAFQLKGSGWYVTDFRDQGKKDKAGAPGNSGVGDKSGAEPAAPSPDSGSAGKAGGSDASPAQGPSTGSAAGTATSPAP